MDARQLDALKYYNYNYNYNLYNNNYYNYNYNYYYYYYLYYSYFLLLPLLRFCAHTKRNNNTLITTTTNIAITITSARGLSLRHSSTSAGDRRETAPTAACPSAASSTVGASTTAAYAHRPIAAALTAAASASPIMGSCFGRCISKETHAATTSCLWRQTTDEQEADLMSNASEKCRRERFIFRIIKFKSKQKRPQFIDQFWAQKDLSYSKLAARNGHESVSDIQLQNLDVHNLFHTAAVAKESALNGATGSQPAATASSRASSSLDLEWEHEYAHHMRPHYAHQTHYTAQALLNDSHSHSHMNNNNSQQQHNHNIGTYDNPIVQLDDSWHFLSNDDEQLNSLASGSQSLSLPPIVGDAELAAAATASDRNESERGREHDRRLVRAYAKVPTARNGSLTRTSSSHNSWSHISTPESLEWDQDEEQQRQLRVEDDNLDHETLELLHQIEQLKNRVLNETGDGGWCESDATADGPGDTEFSAAKVTATTTTTTTKKMSGCDATANIS